MNEEITMLKLSKIHRRILLTAVAISCLSVPPVHAENNYTITYREAELTSIEGRIAVHERIVKAAKNHCPNYNRTKSLGDIANCVDDVVSDLVEKIDHPQFTAFVNGELNNITALAESE